MSAQPVLLMIAGPNGSGKTTLTRQLVSEGVNLGFYVNPDDIAAGLKGSYDRRVAAAQARAEAQRNRCLAKRESFSFETVMSHPSKIEVLRRARSMGFYNVLYFVSTETPLLNVSRVQQRVQLGGHDVPTMRIISRYQRTMALLPQAIGLCDRIVLFDNSYRPSRGAPIKLTPFCEIFRNESSAAISFAEGGKVPSWARGIYAGN